MRWDSSARVTAAQRDSVQGAGPLVVIGHNGWPFTEVPVNIVGWAVRDRAQLEWTDANYSGYPGGVAHHYGLDDFYDWGPDVGGFLMKAGSATRITEFDTRMLRDCGGT